MFPILHRMAVAAVFAVMASIAMAPTNMANAIPVVVDLVTPTGKQGVYDPNQDLLFLQATDFFAVGRANTVNAALALGYINPRLATIQEALALFGPDGYGIPTVSNNFENENYISAKQAMQDLAPGVTLANFLLAGADITSISFDDDAQYAIYTGDLFTDPRDRRNEIEYGLLIVADNAFIYEPPAITVAAPSTIFFIVLGVIWVTRRLRPDIAPSP
tara:strand:+ start:277 stop:927 length:651 start_codon:yes stop_codon:yes gene_type:complete